MSKQQNLIKLVFTCIFALLLGVYTIPWYVFGIDIPFTAKEYKLGLDLQGGIELDYKVDLEEVRRDPNNTRQIEKNIIEGLKSIIDKRVEVLKINDSQITSANYGGEEHIIVQIPLKGNNSEENKINIQRAKEAIGKVVKIEFKEARTKITEKDIQEREIIAKRIASDLKLNPNLFNALGSKFRDSYENVELINLSETATNLKKYLPLDPTSLKTGDLSQVLIGTGKTALIGAEGNLNLENSLGDKGFWIVKYKGKEGEKFNLEGVFISAKPSSWQAATDKKGRILNDKYFIKSSVQYNQAYQPMVELTFNNEGAEIFGELTKRLTGKPIAIFVGGQLLTAPTVNEAITSGKAVITGDYTSDEASKLAQNINTGVVPAPIYLTSEKSIDSRLGANSLQELIIAGIFGYLMIVVFLIITYRASGVAAAFTLLLYIAIVLTIVKSLGIVLTLASIAGLILSLGMAIDANILIFERIKDELREDKSMDISLKNGFQQSFSAIWDGHITGILVAVVLFVFGINLIKGFGLMLIIGTAVSLFVFYNISRIFTVVLGKSKISHSTFIGLKK